MKNSYESVKKQEEPPEIFMHSLLRNISELKKLLLLPHKEAHGGLEKQTVITTDLKTVIKRYFIPGTDEVVCMFVHKNNNIHFYERNRSQQTQGIHHPNQKHPTVSTGI